MIILFMKGCIKMKVSELIKQLEQYDGDLDVMVSTRDDRAYDINEVGPCLDQESAYIIDDEDYEWKMKQNPDLKAFIALDIWG
jgi:hypothetical protein